MVEDTQKRYADDVTLQELVRLRVENERLRKALERIAQYDIQAWAIDALAPNTRIQQKESE